ncbi:MAG: GvpL/GvpF family gas vesicle protein [Planctomycetes bacterium]|nr:GvpL/GvpF family gas vesicle protein [Planctomycetota bacterium]
MAERHYIYAVLGVRGLPCSGLVGIDGAPVELVPVKDLAAVVSRTWHDRFDGADEGTLMSLVARHQEVNQSLLGAGSLVPFRFGMVASGKEEVRETVSRLYLQLKAALKRVTRHVELAVQARWDHAKVAVACASSDREVAALREEFARHPSQELQIRVGKRLFELVEERRREAVESILSRLKPAAAAVTLHRLLDADMILNGAFLVEQDREAEFDRAVEEAARTRDGDLQVKRIGPLPPYSFCDLELQADPWELLDAARTTLALPEQASLADVREAFRRLASEHHPDRGDAGPEDYRRYQEIVGAYDLLTAYCESFVHRLVPGAGEETSTATAPGEALLSR